MPWTAGALTGDPAAQATLVTLGPVTHGRQIACVIVLAWMPSSEQPALGFIALLEKVAADGATVLSTLPIPVATAFTVTPEIGPIHLAVNERLRVRVRDAVVGEVAASIFDRDTGGAR